MRGVPDIDLDFPRDIREKLIVRVTERYGREHAALVASFATYRSRGAIRDVGKALGLPHAELERLAKITEGWNAKKVAQELATLPDAKRKLLSPRWRAFVECCAEIAGLPRHISQHPGGMIISSRPLVELVPVQPAAMVGRQLCQWDKDSCSDAGFMKIDLLGLGMLSAVEECVSEVARVRGESIDLSRISLVDPAVYDDIQSADTVGTFQIESRAQMQSLLRTRPENLEDLTVQVALVRPGPIQGKAVHPYVKNRELLRADPTHKPTYDHPLLEEPLGETYGAIVFQDQVLHVAMALAGFSVGEAEGLRRAMSRKRSQEALEAFRARFVEGALTKGVDRETADKVYDKLTGFSGFGFPKSHAAAFGLLAYQSAWLRHYYPTEFLCSLLNAQPMGFYPPSTLVRDAQRKGVEVRPPDVNRSLAKCVNEDDAVRMGIEYVVHVGEDDARALVEAREHSGPFRDVRELAQRTELGRDELEALVQSGACDCLGESRRTLLWELGLVPRAQTVPGSGGEEHQLALPLDPTVATPELATQTRWERMLADYRLTSISVGVHPLELLRPHLPDGTLSSRELREQPHRTRVAVAGMAIARQRPSTAKGIVFMLLEDEFGQVNLIVPPQVYDRYRSIVRGEPLIRAEGRFEKIERNQNVLVDRLETLGPLARRVSGEHAVNDALPTHTTSGTASPRRRPLRRRARARTAGSGAARRSRTRPRTRRQPCRRASRRTCREARPASRLLRREAPAGRRSAPRRPRAQHAGTRPRRPRAARTDRRCPVRRDRAGGRSARRSAVERSRELSVQLEMRLGGGCPRQRLACAAGALARGLERVGIVEKLARGFGQAVDVPRRHDSARAEAPHGLGDPTDVVTDRRHAGTERLHQRRALVELRAVREERHGPLAERAVELGLRQVAEPPLDPVAASLDGLARVAGDEQARVLDPPHDLERVRQTLVRPDRPREKQRAAVVAPFDVRRRDRQRDHARVDAELRERSLPRSLCTTTRSKRARRRRHRSSFEAVRRGRRSCAVKTDGARRRSRRSSSCGDESHWTWTTSAGRRFSRNIPSGCSSPFTGTRSRERRNTRELTG